MNKKKSYTSIYFSKIKSYFTNHIILLIVLGIFISIFVMPIVIKYLYEVKLPFPLFQIITRDNYDAWISYYGSIVGGALTLIGVWWTLNEQQKQFNKNLEEQKEISNNQLKAERERFEVEMNKKNDELKLMKKQRKEDLAIQYKPILSLNFSHSIINNFPTQNTSIICYLELKNIGRGELINLKVLNNKDENPYHFVFSYEKNQMITLNDNPLLMINIVKYIATPGSNQFTPLPINTNDNFNLSLSVMFNDAFSNQYTYVYDINFEYKVTIDSKCIKSFTVKDSKTLVEPTDPNQSLNIEPTWIAHISIPKIYFKEV